MVSSPKLKLSIRPSKNACWYFSLIELSIILAHDVRIQLPSVFKITKGQSIVQHHLITRLREGELMWQNIFHMCFDTQGLWTPACSKLDGYHFLAKQSNGTPLVSFNFCLFEVCFGNWERYVWSTQEPTTWPNISQLQKTQNPPVHEFYEVQNRGSTISGAQKTGNNLVRSTTIC